MVGSSYLDGNVYTRFCYQRSIGVSGMVLLFGNHGSDC